MAVDRGGIGYGLLIGRLAAGGNSYAANTGRARYLPIGEWVSNVNNPFVRKPNGGARRFIFKDVVGGSPVVGANVWLREHYSQLQLGGTLVADVSGAVTFRNLDTSSGVYYTVCAIHPNSANFNAAIADWVQANPV